jgi:hypothetical protein
MNAIFASVLLFLGTMVPWAQPEPPAPGKLNFNSPLNCNSLDGLFFAKAQIVQDELGVRGLLVVRHKDTGNRDTYVSYHINDLISHMEWSSDSKFLVMTTVNLGGHSRGQPLTYVYCVEDKSLRCIDDVIGMVVDPKFEFVGPHTLAMKVAGPSPVFNSQIPKVVNVDLTKQAAQMPQQGGKEEGTLPK